jgi:hypothetical protein
VALFKEVELFSIGKTRVYLPPNTKITTMLRKKYADRYPPQPSKQIKLATPKGQKEEYETILIVDGPKYDAWRKECDAIDAERWDEGEGLNYLFSLKDVVVPDDFDVEAQVGDEARYIDPDWKPRPDKLGRKLDYIEWIVLGNSHDQDVVGAALRQLLGLDQEVVQDVIDTFPDQVAGETA